VRTKYVAPLAVLLAISAGVTLVFGQRTVPFSNGIPVAPTGLANKPLGPGPFVYDTGEGMKIRVVVVTKGLSYPFSMTWLPDGTMLVTENPSYFRTDLPKYVPQFFVFSLSADAEGWSKDFKRIVEENFPVEILKSMIDK